MSLIICPDCRQEVSNRAAACPRCGYPVAELSSIHDAAAKNNVLLVQDIIKSGVSPDQEDENGRTALMIASRNGNLGVVKALIESGVNVNRSSYDGTTALMEAALHGHTRIVQALLNVEADPLLRNEDGFSAIDLARQKHKKSVASLLQEKIILFADATPQYCPPVKEEFEDELDSSARLLRRGEPETDNGEDSALHCLTCSSSIQACDLQCKSCKTPIIRRYCRCNRLIPDHAQICPYCSTQKLARFRYIRGLEHIVVGSAVALILGLFLFNSWSGSEEHRSASASVTAMAQLEQKKIDQDRPQKTTDQIEEDADIKADQPQYNFHDYRLKQEVASSSSKAPVQHAIEQQTVETPAVVPEASADSKPGIGHEKSTQESPAESSVDSQEPPVDQNSLQGEVESNPQEDDEEREKEPVVEESNMRQEQEVRSLRIATRLNSVGFNLMQAHRYNEAIQILRRALDSFPSKNNIAYAWTLYNLGRALRLGGHPDLAIPILEKRLKYADQREVVVRELQAARRAADGGLYYE